MKRQENNLSKRLLAAFSIALLLTVKFLPAVLDTYEPHIWISRLVFSLMMIVSGGVLGFHYQKVLKGIKSFFCESTHPLNLSIFRVIFFGYFLIFYQVGSIMEFALYPKELMIPPFGTGWIAPYLPITTETLSISYLLFKVSAFMACIGIFTRYSILVFCLSSLYMLGVPQLFGKVNHYHHIIFIAFILLNSKCSELLSVDGIFKSIKLADKGIIHQEFKPSTEYALPLRIIWVVIGALYFWPGFWKIWNVGFDWALSENLKFHLYHKWQEYPGWLPFFRIDHYPLMYKLVGLGTLIFECGFLFLLFLPSIRAILGVSGFMFHTMINVFMRINFFTLQIVYFSFVNWQKLFEALGNIMFKNTLIILYDGNCELCRRTMASMKTFDVLNRVKYVNYLDSNETSKIDLKGIKDEDMQKDMHAIDGDKTFKGFYSYRQLSKRIPLLWAALPFLYIWPVTYFGNKIYGNVASHRACSVAYARPKEVKLEDAFSFNKSRAMIAIGVIIFSVSMFVGLKRTYYGWPFACYPTFDVHKNEFIRTLGLKLTFKDGRTQDLNFDEFAKGKNKVRYVGFINKVVNSEDQAHREEKLRYFWKLILNKNNEYDEVKEVGFYKVINSVVPEKQNVNPVRKVLLYQYTTIEVI